MTPSATASLDATQGRIDELVAQVFEQCPSARGDLKRTREMGEKVCFALRGLDQRQQNGTQHLPDVDVLFRKTGEMLEVFERTLLTHVSGENGSLMVWHANEREVVRGLGTVFEVYGHTSGLVLLYNETLEAFAKSDPSDQMAAYCRIVQEVTSNRAEWHAKCKGHTFDPEPINDLFNALGRESRLHLTPANSSLGPLAPGPEDAPPAYETVTSNTAETSSSSRSGRKAPQKAESSVASAAANPSSSSSSSKNNSNNTKSTKISPRKIISIPRRSRQNEKVHVSLTPDASGIVIWSVDSVEFYSSGTAGQIWRLGSEDAELSKNGMPCQFSKLCCFSPDGSLLTFTTTCGLTGELIVIRASDGQILGKRQVIARQVLSVSISHSNRKIALSCLSHGKSNGGITLILRFDPAQPEGFCFIGAGDDPEMKEVDEKLPVPTVASRFTPDDVHVIVSVELFQTTTKPAGYIYRYHHIRIFEAGRRAVLIKEWKVGRSKTMNQPACDAEFLFPRDESTGRHKWLMAWNGEDTLDPLKFKLADVAHEETLMEIKEGHHALSFRQFWSGLWKGTIWAKVRFCDDGTWTYIVRRGRRGQGRISLTRGWWDGAGWHANPKDSTATMLTIGVDDDWQISNDGRLAVTYQKDKGWAELWSL